MASHATDNKDEGNERNKKMIVIGIIGLCIAAAGMIAQGVTSAQARSAQERAAQKMKDQADINKILANRANRTAGLRALQTATQGMMRETLIARRREWQADQVKLAVKKVETDLNIPRPERPYGNPRF